MKTSNKLKDNYSQIEHTVSNLLCHFTSSFTLIHTFFAIKLTQCFLPLSSQWKQTEPFCLIPCDCTLTQSRDIQQGHSRWIHCSHLVDNANTTTVGVKIYAVTCMQLQKLHKEWKMGLTTSYLPLEEWLCRILLSLSTKTVSFSCKCFHCLVTDVLVI